MIFNPLPSRIMRLLNVQAILLLLLCALPGSLRATAQAGTAAHPAESPLMRQLHQALSLAQQGEADQAMAIVDRMLHDHPAFVPAIKAKGMLFEHAGRNAEAGAAYEQGLKLAPNDPDLVLKTGIYKLATGNRDEAIKLLQRCTRMAPADGDAQFYLAQAYHLNGQDDLALRAMRQSVKADPENAVVLQKYGELLCSTGDYAGGQPWLQKAQGRDAKLPMIEYDLAWADYNLMNLGEAEEYATRAARRHPDDPRALLLLASTQLKLSHWRDAEDNFEHLLTLKEPDANLLLDLGHCQLELNNYADAVKNLQAALRLDPTLLLAHFYLSRAYATTGKTADAQREASLHHLMMERATFVRSQESDQREAAIKAQTRDLLAAHDEAAALNLYREHFKGTSATPGDAYVFVGKTYLFMGHTENGLRCLDYALKTEPHVRGAHTYKGILALTNGDLTKAEDEFNAELANDPNYQTAIGELGEVRYRQGRWAEAAEQLTRSHTNTPELLYMLCDADLHLGKAEDADLTADLVAAYGRNNQRLMQDLITLLRSNGHAETAERLASTLSE